MTLSAQNKNFLSLLHKLGIDVKQFPDKTFDGLFDNIPKGMNYFFNWLFGNITTENVLTDLEESVFFELEKKKSLCSVDEIEYFLSINKPSFEELQFLDSYYVNFFLTEELKELKKHQKNLNDITEDIQLICEEVKQKHNSVKEETSFWKRQINETKENTNKINSLLADKLLKSKTYLETKSFYQLNLEFYKSLFQQEKIVFQLLKTDMFEKSCSCDSIFLKLLPKLEKDLINVDMILTLSLSCLNEKKTKVEALSDFLHKKKLFSNLEDSTYCNSSNLNISNLPNSSNVVDEDNLNIEINLMKDLQELSQLKVQKISNIYFEKTRDLRKFHLEKLVHCKKYMLIYKAIYSLMAHIMFDSVDVLKKVHRKKKHHIFMLHENEKNFDSWLRNFELRKEIFNKNSVQKNPSQLLRSSYCGGNLEVEEELFSQILIHSMEDSNFITHKFRWNLQLLVKSLFNNILCGPTNQLLLADVNLLTKYQKCEQKEKNVSHLIKCLVNKYLETKENVLKSNRKKLLSWADFLSNHSFLEDVK